MTIPQAVLLGVAANQLSKKIAGSDEVTAGRTAVAMGLGAGMGAATSGAVVLTVATAAAPVVLPLALATCVIAGIASRFG